MEMPVTLTKVVVPSRRPDLLSRPRLLEQLYEMLEQKVIILAAPAGYGKTSLLIDLAHSSEMKVCWYALDELDRDPHRFAAHVIASLQRGFPGFGEQSLAALSGDFDIDRLSTALVNDMFTHIGEHFILVIDDFHLVDDVEAIDYFINCLIHDAGENCHLIIASRTLISLPDLPLFVVRGMVSGLSFEELAFQKDEIQALVLQNQQIVLTPQQIQKLSTQTEGWITGLLLTQAVSKKGSRRKSARVVGVDLYDYLAQQVLADQPKAIHDFLLQTSLFEEFDANLCRQVFGDTADWDDMVAQVLHSNLFVLPVSAEGTWLRYHHLFRNFLRIQLRKEFPDEEANILRRLLEVFRQQGEWEKGHGICQRLRDPVALVDLVAEAGSPLIRSGRIKLLDSWLQEIPSATFQQRPELLSLQGGVEMMQGKAETGLNTLNQAIALLSENQVQHLPRALIRRATAHRFLGNYTASLQDAQKALDLCENQADLLSVQAEAMRTLGLNFARLGQLEESAIWLEKSLQEYRALKNEQNIVLLLMELGNIFLITGKYKTAKENFQQAIAEYNIQHNPMQQANALNNLGVLEHLCGNFQAAVEHLETSLQLARHSGYARTEAFALLSLGDVYFSLRAIPAAQQAYQKAKTVSIDFHDRYLNLHIHLAMARIAQMNKQTAQAADCLAQAQILAEQSHSDFEQGLWHLTAGKIAYFQHDFQKAYHFLETAAQYFSGGQQQVENLQTTVAISACLWMLGEEQPAQIFLQNATGIADGLESDHTLITALGEFSEILPWIQKQTLPNNKAHLAERTQEFLDQLPALRRQVRQHTSEVTFAPPHLTIQSLGREQVLLNGQTISAPEWASRKPVRELFFCLLAHPEGMSKEAIGVIFWPDASPSQLKLRFKNNVYRLRHALGQKIVAFDGRRYRINTQLDYQYDVEDFSRYIQQAEQTHSEADQRTWLEKAAALYQGVFLPETEGTWVWPVRENLRRSYLHSISTLIDILLQNGEALQAIKLCAQALLQDPCQENIYRQAMRAYASMGDRAGVIRQFKRCKQALMEEIQTSPSEQTLHLFQTLTR